MYTSLVAAFTAQKETHGPIPGFTEMHPPAHEAEAALQSKRVHTRFSSQNSLWNRLLQFHIQFLIRIDREDPAASRKGESGIFMFGEIGKGALEHASPEFLS